MLRPLYSPKLHRFRAPLSLILSVCRFPGLTVLPFSFVRQTLVKNSLIIVFECGFTRFVPFSLLSPVFAVGCVAVACAAVAVVVNFLKKKPDGKTTILHLL